MIKVITFDLDDTLWDVTPVLVRAEKRLAAWLQVHCAPVMQQFSIEALRALRMELVKQRPDLLHQITESRRFALQTAMERVGISSDKASELAARAMKVFMVARHHVELFDEVEEVISQLHDRYLLGVLTNGNADIYRLPLGRYFAFAYSAESLNSSKPMPLHFERTLLDTGATPDQVVHVGDHLEHDIAAAQRFGWHTIWFDRKQQAPPLAPEPSATIRRFAELPGCIRQIESRLGQPHL